ncbi:MAG: GAK system XXXCH domain-containing protein [Proteobacteria bacterium]|nr:GAK system XXXCH domain-containing protein [Pseudomonadota bacterium]MBU1593977.1 GAK system XXXCH domain-containing protein [Pseudomonadota bacterium]
MGSWKTEAELDEVGLPGLLRELASALETGLAGGGLDGMPVRDLHKLVLVAERRKGGLRVKIKAKRAGEVLVPAAALAGPEPAAAARPRDRDKALDGRDKYRQLKKGLQTEYKALQASAREGRLPAAEALESFLGLAELMGQARQPVSGAALAEMARAGAAFWSDCQALRQAYAARDAAALAAVLERLARRKSACHAQFRQEGR